jgi:general secretion pathway protein D
LAAVRIGSGNNDHCPGIIQRTFFMRNYSLILALGVTVGLALPAAAQFPGGFGGFGGQQNRQGAAGAANTRQYNNSTTVGSATISSDPESGQIIVITDEETSIHISQVISNLNIPKPQVLIKVVFLEVTYNNSSDIGIDAGFIGQIGSDNNPDRASVIGGNIFGASALNIASNLVQYNALGLPISPIGTTPPGAGLYQVLGSDYQATLRAIAQAGKTEVLSRPSILARNNQPAVITVGQSVPLITNVRYDNFGNAINSVSYEDVGIILRVTPFISSDGLVEMIVSPEISSLTDQTVAIANGVSVPVIAKRSADTVVVTPDGQPVIIGGLMQNNKTSSESKIPLLGDIPLLGHLFKRSIKNNNKTELLIFLTPHIVQAPSELFALSERERANTVLPKRAFSDKDMEQFIDGLPKNPEPAKGRN